MGHKPEKALFEALEHALSLVEAGGRYTHYKDPERIYVVRSLTFAEADDSIMVVYQAEYGSNFTFVRPLASWLETVSVDGKEVPRFKKVSTP